MKTFETFLNKIIETMWLIISFGFKFTVSIAFILLAFGPILLLIAKLLE